jgi:hypothetical protein
MPLSFRKKRKEIQKLQEQQRLRILSILESEDQNAQVREEGANTVSTLRQTSDCDILSLNPVASTDLSIDILDSKKSLPASNCPPTTLHRTERMIAGNEKDESPKTKTSVKQDNLVYSETSFDGEGRSIRLDKNHLKNIVVHAKAERVMRHGSFHREVETPRLESDPQSDRELELKPAVCDAQKHEYLGKKKTPRSIVTAMQRERELPPQRTSTGQHNKEYLGKKKSPYSILQEKRMLKEMDKIVKDRLRALEESEETRDMSDRIQPFCGCSILPTCT